MLLVERERTISKQEKVVKPFSEGNQDFPRREIPLTAEQLNKLTLAAMGLLDKEIARILIMEHDSVGNAFHLIFRKLRVGNKHEAVVVAINSAWIDPLECVGESDLFPFGTLTPRQVDIAELNAMGYANREIADRLGIGAKTVENDNNEIYSCLGIKAGERVCKKARLAVLYHAYRKREGKRVIIDTNTNV